MRKKQLLLARLDEIAQALAQHRHARALIGLGSVGAELERVDDYSDLDFFVVVEDGYKDRFLTPLDWLTSVHPVAYQFRNTPDGYKLLFADDVFCEFAVFEIGELATIPFAPGRIVWKRTEVDDGIHLPVRSAESGLPKTVEWLLGEALTNLYVGLGRYQRGEKLSAARLIQHYAVERIVELTPYLEAERAIPRDAFAPERRYEARFPRTALQLGQFMQGYERSRESAQAILAFLERHFDVNPHLALRIRELCRPTDHPA